MTEKETELADKLLQEAISAPDSNYRHNIIAQYSMLVSAACERRRAMELRPTQMVSMNIEPRTP